jgi:hypothetical protein
MVKQSPGFVRGTWFGDDRRGHGVVLYEPEEQAQQGVQEVGLERGGVVVVSSEIYRLHGRPDRSPVTDRPMTPGR